MLSIFLLQYYLSKRGTSGEYTNVELAIGYVLMFTRKSNTVYLMFRGTKFLANRSHTKNQFVTDTPMLFVSAFVQFFNGTCVVTNWDLFCPFSEREKKIVRRFENELWNSFEWFFFLIVTSFIKVLSASSFFTSPKDNNVSRARLSCNELVETPKMRLANHNRSW